MYQVQIYNSEVCEWYGWSGNDIHESKKDAEKEAAKAKRFGWKTRIVKVK